MSPEELKIAVMALSSEEKKSLILSILPDIAREAMEDPDFMMQLFPVMLGIVRESGVDVQQLLQFAAAMDGSPCK